MPDQVAIPAAEMVPIERLKPWVKNPRKNDKAVRAVADSIARFGFANPILARREDGRVIAGHTRLKAAILLGLAEAPVRYLDLGEEEADALALADNRLGELAEWDDAALAEILQGLGDRRKGLGWTEDDIAEILAGAALPDDGDEAPPVPAEAVSVLGEVYELGPHRLTCGDSTDPAVWARLLGGERIRMIWTDPPYGVAVNSGTPEQNAAAHRRTDGLLVQNDDLTPEALRALLDAVFGAARAACDPGAAWYVAAPAGPLFAVFGAALGDIWRHTLIWKKDVFAFGRSDYHYCHEPIFYGWVDGGPHHFADDRTQHTVMEFARPKKSTEHPTMKPIPLVRKCIVNSSRPGWIVGDPFGGSGTTLLAAACEGRIARLIELDPRYCDVIRRRWTKWARENNQEVGSGGLEA